VAATDDLDSKKNLAIDPRRLPFTTVEEVISSMDPVIE
jgi:hypothetical protein